jgi:hypothetical protein
MDDSARQGDAAGTAPAPEPPRPHARRSKRKPVTRPGLRRLARVPLWALLVVMAATIAVVLSYASAAPNYVAPPPVPSATTPTPAPTPTTTPSSAPDLPQLGQAISALEQKYQVSLGVSISPVFTPSKKPVAVWHGGSLSDGYAWSTIDVPVAIAVANDAHQPNDLIYFLGQAFNETSTAGDQALWQWLGDDEQAAAQTTAVLRAGADQNTTIPIGDPGSYAAFSQTLWALDDQASWLGATYSTGTAWLVLTYLPEPPDDQRFGLARITNARTKASWGTQPNGALSVRQFGLLPANGVGPDIAVSVAAVPLDGSLATATAALNELALEIEVTPTGFTGTC